MDKRKKTISSSKGSRHVLQQSKRYPKDHHYKEKVISSPVTISNIINSCACIPSCLQRIFTDDLGNTDYNGAVAFFQTAQNEFLELDEDAQDIFIIGKFKESIINMPE
jgi:hypothetical protein